MDAHRLRLLLVARAQLVSQRQALANTIRGLLKSFGHRLARGSGGLFAPRVREAAEGNDALLAVAEPLLAAWQALREQVAVLDGQLLARAQADATARRLMTVPGVGVVVALAYRALCRIDAQAAPVGRGRLGRVDGFHGVESCSDSRTA